MPKLTLEEAISKRRTHRAFDDRPVAMALLHKLLWAAQGVTDNDGNRTVPSAHALHPLRLYVTTGRIEATNPGVYTAATDPVTLTPHLGHDPRVELEKAALDEQPWITHAPAIITICADMVVPSQDFAAQPPYGLRGRRYVYIEAGAAAQNIALQATTEGLACALIAGVNDQATAEVLQLSAPLEPILHMCIGWPANSTI